MSILIEMHNITKKFSGVVALNNVNFNVKEGEVHALIGENGAGKSTLIKIIAGIYNFSGDFFYKGKSTAFSNPSEAIKAGIRVIYQELNLCETISVAENIFIGRIPHKNNGFFIDRKRLYDESRKYLNDIGLDISPNAILENLPTSKKQMVEIIKAISTDAKLIVMDEPTSSLSNREIKNLFLIIEKLKQRNISIIYVSHKLDEIFEISDRITVLRDGELIGTKNTQEATQEDIIHMMVGRKVSSFYTRVESSDSRELIFEVQNITTAKLKDISFKVNAGEIVGFFGLIGAGRTELAKAVFGFDHRVKGKVFLDGKEIAPNRTHVSKERGIGYVSEDRKNEGILPDLTIKENISITILDKITKGLFINSTDEFVRVKSIVDKIKIKTPSLFSNPLELSGGNQQKLILARWLIAEGIRILIVDEPTRGIDIGAKTEIYALLDRLAHEGMAIIIMSSEMNEILNVCDKIYVMSQGCITGEFTRREATSELLLKKSIV